MLMEKNGNDLVQLYSKLNPGLKRLNGICSMRQFAAENQCPENSLTDVCIKNVHEVETMR